jgi:hypothetical protein
MLETNVIRNYLIITYFNLIVKYVYLMIITSKRNEI